MEEGPKKGYVKMPFQKPENVEGPSADYYDIRFDELEVGQIDDMVKQAVDDMAHDRHKLKDWSPEDEEQKPE